MIYRWDSTHAVAVMADGKVSISSCSDDESVSWLDHQFPDGVTAQKVCVQLSMLVMLTSNNRVIVCLGPKNSFEDITADVYQILQGTLDIRNIDICADRTIVIITSNRVAIVEADVQRMEYIVTFKGRILCETQCEIDMHTVDCHRGCVAVRTTNNCLYRVNKSGTIRGPGSSLSTWNIQLLEFHDGANVCEIVCNGYSMFLLMHNGTVYAQNFLGGELRCETPRLFRQITFPENETVIKIVVVCVGVFFITAAGNCYYASEHTCNMGGAIEIQLLSLCVDIVEDIYALRYGWAVQHSGGCVCILHTASLPNRNDGVKPYQHVFEQYADGTAKPRLIPFFDDKSVVSIVRLFKRTYFITNKGHVYWFEDWTVDFDETTELTIARDPYFDANPLAVKRGAQSIRSACSLLK